MSDDKLKPWEHPARKSWLQETQEELDRKYGTKRPPDPKTSRNDDLGDL